MADCDCHCVQHRSAPSDVCGAYPPLTKNVSDRFVFGNAISVSEMNQGISSEWTEIYKDGSPVPPANALRVLSDRNIKIKYIWSVPEDHFNGTATGLAHPNETIKPGDTFKIKLPGDASLKFEPFGEYRKIGSDPSKNFGSWRIQNGSDSSGKPAQFIEGYFGEAIATPGSVSEGTYLSELTNGFFEVIARTSGAGNVDLKLGTAGTSILLAVLPNKHVPEWDPGNFYKQSSTNATHGFISWALVTGYDNLKKAFEEPSDTTLNKSGIVVYDTFPKTMDVTKVQLQVPIYYPTPEINYDEQGNVITSIPAGKLSWGCNHEICIEYDLNQSSSNVIRNQNETLEDFVNRIKQAGTNSADGMPAVGFFEDAEKKVVVVGLGASPNAKMSYSALFQKGQYYEADKEKYFLKSGASGDISAFDFTLAKFLEIEKNTNVIDQGQYNIMKRVYVGDTPDDASDDPKVLAWTVAIFTDVDRNVETIYQNDAVAEFEMGPGTDPIRIPAHSTAHFIALKSGVEGVKRLAFTVTKEWKNSSGGNINPDRDEVRIDVYREEGGKQVKMEGYSIPLFKKHRWKGIVTGLPIFDHLGNPVSYSVREETVEGYESSVSPANLNVNSSEKRFQITNTKKTIADPKKITVKKTWVGSSTKKTVTVYLKKKTGGAWETVDRADLKEGSWEHTFENLTPDAEYDVEEAPLLGYESKKEPKTDPSDAKHTIYTFTNTQLAPNPLVDIHVKKVWSGDKENQATLELYAAVGEEAPKPQKRVILTHPNWSYTFEKMPTRVDGKNITYSVKEIPITGYESVVSYDESTKTFTVTNTKSRITKDIKVKKQWIGARKDSAALELWSNQGSSGSLERLASITLDRSNDWKGVFSNIKTYRDNSVPYLFEVRETPIEGYTAEITGDIDNGFVVTNRENTSAVVPPAPPAPPADSDTTEDESDTTEQEEDTSEKTTSPAASTSTSGTTTSGVTTTAATTTGVMTTAATDETTETAVSSIPDLSDSSETSLPDPFVFDTAAPTAAATTRTFEFVEIDEDVPLGIRTTAPLDLELILLEEDIPLSGIPMLSSLPYTYSVPAELFIGMGLLILTLGLTFVKRL